MYKRLLIILIISIFLITSVGAISASNSISVKVVWDGGDAPDHVTVNLVKDGKVVDSAELSSKNSWKTTFNVDDEGNYNVTESASEDYSSKITGDEMAGFVITNHLVNDVLKSGDEDGLEDSSADDTGKDDGAKPDDNQKSNADDTTSDGGQNSNDDSQEDGTNSSDDNPAQEESNSTDNSTDEESTDNSTEEDDATENVDPKDEDSDNGDENVTETTKLKITEITKKSKVVKKDNKKPENTTKIKNDNTGFPIAILVCAVFVAAFIPLSRRK